MFIDALKKQIAASMKSGDTVARDVLRLALGEIQTDEARKNAPATDEEAAAAVRKLIKANKETMTLAADDASERSVALKREIEILRALLPKAMTVDEIVAALAPQVDAIKAAKNDGQATGLAVKHLKPNHPDVDGTDVGAAVKKIRG